MITKVATLKLSKYFSRFSTDIPEKNRIEKRGVIVFGNLWGVFVKRGVIAFNSDSPCSLPALMISIKFSTGVGSDFCSLGKFSGELDSAIERKINYRLSFKDVVK